MASLANNVQKEFPESTLTQADHERLMEVALEEALSTPQQPLGQNRFRVGAVLADASNGRVLSKGHSFELGLNAYEGYVGAAHAEECCFIKYAQEHGKDLSRTLPEHTVLYTTLEPCSKRLTPGSTACTSRILSFGGRIRTVYVGIREPGDFIECNDGQRLLEDHGIQVVFPVEHWRDRVTEVTMTSLKNETRERLLASGSGGNSSLSANSDSGKAAIRPIIQG